MGSQPPLKIFFSKSGGVDRCSTPPSKIQGGLRPPPGTCYNYNGNTISHEKCLPVSKCKIIIHR